MGRKSLCSPFECLSRSPQNEETKCRFSGFGENTANFQVKMISQTVPNPSARTLLSFVEPAELCERSEACRFRFRAELRPGEPFRCAPLSDDASSSGSRNDPSFLSGSIVLGGASLPAVAGGASLPALEISDVSSRAMPRVGGGMSGTGSGVWNAGLSPPWSPTLPPSTSLPPPPTVKASKPGTIECSAGLSSGNNNSSLVLHSWTSAGGSGSSRVPILPVSQSLRPL